MAVVINGSGTVTGLAVGGLPDGTVDNDTVASGLASSKLTGALPAISAASLTNVPKDVTVGGRKNIIINGAMNVYQRGSVNITDAGNEYTLDRFQAYWRGGALATATQDTDVPAGQGFSSSIKMDVTTGDSLGTSNDLVLFRQKIEAQDLQHLEYGHANAKTMTLTFWIKSTVTGTYILRASQSDASDRINSTAYTVSSANTWEKKTITIAGDTSGVIDNNTGNGLELTWCLGSGSDYTSGTRSDNTWIAYDATKQFQGQVNAVNSASNNIYITGVQLEVGSVATDFEHRSYGEELALCHRYYEVITGGLGMGIVKSTTAADCAFQPKVNKRAAPTISFSGTIFANDGSAQQGASLSSTGGTQDGLIVIIGFSSLNVGRACMLYTSGLNGRLIADSEL